jgi:hypothetical protein
MPVELSGRRRFCSDGCRLASRNRRAAIANRKKLYGITAAQFSQMLSDQGGVCAICQTPDWPAPSGQAGPHVDHDHVTGKVRGILCQSCNHGLGKFKDDPKRLRAAADYLERANVTSTIDVWTT